MKFKMIGVLAAVALLGACADKATTSGAATGSGVSSGTAGVTPGSQQDLVANVGDRVFYALDSSSLEGDGRSTLDRQAGWLARYPQTRVQVAGNCDERGTTEYNLALGSSRASAVRNYMVSQGVPDSRISIITYGRERPVATCPEESCFAQNRRAVTVVTGGPGA